MAFEAWSFDDKGRFLRKEKATWSLDGLAGEISADGRLTTARPATTAGKVKATVGELSATTQVALLRAAALELRLRAGRVPRHWIGAGPRFKVADLGGGKRLQKPPLEAGLQRATVFIGPAHASPATRSRPTSWSRKQGRRVGRRRPHQPGLHARPHGQEGGAAAADLGLRAREVDDASRSPPSPTSGTA